MPRTFTLAELRTRVQDMVDIQSDGNVGTTELNSMISAAYAKYYAKTAKSGLGYPGETTQTFTTTGGTPDVIALPADHFATQRVDYAFSSVYWNELQEADVRELAFFPPTTSYATHFRLVGTNLVLYPTPPINQSYRHIYIPAPAKLTTDGQTVDGVCGWEELILFEVAIRIKMKREEDAAPYVAERDKIEIRLDEEIAMRILTRSRRIILRRTRVASDPSDYYPYDNYWRDE